MSANFSRCHLFPAVLLLSLLAAAPVRGESWIPVGAPGGNVRALAYDPSRPERLYLGTGEGILYRSDNAGASWIRLQPGFPCRSCSLDEIQVAPDGTLYVGYWEVHGRGGGVARSADFGATFTLLPVVQGESVRALAIAPSNPRVIAAGTLTGVFLSRNRGQDWQRISPPGHRDLRNFESLVFDPRDPRVLYAGTWHLAWKTSDGGAHWTPAHRGMIDDSDVMTLTVDRRDPETVFATACSGVYRSAPGAEAWSKMSGIDYSSRRTRAFAQDPGKPSLLLAGTTEGLWMSEDDGATWNRVTRKELVVNAVLPLPDGSILLGTEGAGVLRTTDGGRTWVTSNTGFSERFVFKMLFDEPGRRVAVAVWGPPHHSGVFVAPNVGGPWMRLGKGLDGRQVLSLAVLGGTLLAGTDDGIFARESDDAGWVRLPTQLRGTDVHPRVLELLASEPARIVAATPNGVLRSDDHGRSWVRPDLNGAEEVAGLAAPPGNPERIVAATKSGVWTTADGGASWKRISGPLGGGPHELAFAGSDDLLFATTSAGLFRSGDRGRTWRRVEGGLPHSDLTGLAVDDDGRTVYVSDFTFGGIFRSRDGGASWSRMPTDGLGSDRVWTLGVDPAHPGRLLAAASAGGLHLFAPAPRSRARRGSD